MGKKKKDFGKFYRRNENSITISILKDFLVTIIDIWHVVNLHEYHIMAALQIEVCLHVTT